MNGASLVTETLRCAGVDVIFSLSGNQIMPVYDACLDSGIRIVHTRHENAAVYMANAYAQVTGRLGVALVTAAPGFANALSATFSARLDEVPVLLLSGDSPVGKDGAGAFQELDQVAMATPVAKLSTRPGSTAALGAALGDAIRVAQEGRPGPVHLALAADVLLAAAREADVRDRGAFVPAVKPLADADCTRVLGALDSAARPLILTGPLLNPGRARGRLADLERAVGAPVLCLESPRGLRDPALGAFAEVLAQADLVVCLGKAVDYTMGFAAPPALAADARMVIVDPDETALSRARSLGSGREVMAVRADPPSALDALIAQAKPVERKAWRDQVAEAVGYRGDSRTATGVDPRTVAAAVQSALDAAEDPILVVDGGEFGQWSQALISAPVRIINGLSGEIGGGIAHAIGAKIARPKARVIMLMGDGTAGFHLAEFETAAREGTDFVAIIGNDSLWNAEHQIQLRDYAAGRAHGCSMLEGVRYDLAAEAMGAVGAHVSADADFAPALTRMLAAGKPACLNVEIASLGAPDYRRRGPGGT